MIRAVTLLRNDVKGNVEKVDYHVGTLEDFMKFIQDRVETELETPIHLRSSSTPRANLSLERCTSDARRVRAVFRYHGPGNLFSSPDAVEYYFSPSENTCWELRSKDSPLRKRVDAALSMFARYHIRVTSSDPEIARILIGKL